MAPSSSILRFIVGKPLEWQITTRENLLRKGTKQDSKKNKTLVRNRLLLLLPFVLYQDDQVLHPIARFIITHCLRIASNRSSNKRQPRLVEYCLRPEDVKLVQA